MKTHNISGLPVVDEQVLVGIITGRDIRYETEQEKLVKEAMTKDVITVDEMSSSAEAVKLMHKYRIEKLPVIHSSSRKLLGLFTIKDIEQARKHPHATKDSSGRLLCAGAVGVGREELERAERLLLSGCDVLVVDTAHGFSKRVLDTVKEITQTFRQRFDFDLIAFFNSVIFLPTIVSAKKLVVVFLASIDAIDFPDFKIVTSSANSIISSNLWLM